MYGLSSFFIGEQKVTDELGPMMRAAPTEDMQVFLSTQIADEARHVRFFDRFYSEVGVLDVRLASRAAARRPRAHLNPAFNTLFDEMLGSRVRTARRGPDRPRGAGRGDHALPHGDRGHAGAHRPALHHRLQRARGNAARASCGASTSSRATSTATWPSARASCATWWPRTRSTRRRSSARSRRRSPVADEVLTPPWAEGQEDYEFFGVSSRRRATSRRRR